MSNAIEVSDSEWDEKACKASLAGSDSAQAGSGAAAAEAIATGGVVAAGCCMTEGLEEEFAATRANASSVTSIAPPIESSCSRRANSLPQRAATVLSAGDVPTNGELVWPYIYQALFQKEHTLASPKAPPEYPRLVSSTL